MAEIEVTDEVESTHNWSYRVVIYDQGRAYTFQVSLAFSDYDHWSRGRVAPSRVVEAAFKFLLSREGPQEIMRRFDCAVIRRYFPEVDKELPGLL